MKIKRILLDPNPALRAPNAEVTESWDDLLRNVRKMFKVMYREGICLSLSAPQVGWNIRLFIMNPDNVTRKPEKEHVVWNPEIIKTFGDRVKLREGCLSLPKVFGDVLRYPKIILKGTGPKGPALGSFSGLAAHLIQHEMDHLEGKMCWDQYIEEKKVDAQ